MLQPVGLHSTSAKAARNAAGAALVGKHSPPLGLERAIHKGALLVRCARRAHRTVAPHREDLGKATERLAQRLRETALELEAFVEMFRMVGNPWRFPPAEGMRPRSLVDHVLSVMPDAAQGLRETCGVLAMLRDGVAGSGPHGLLHAIGQPSAELLCAAVVRELRLRLYGRTPEPKTVTHWRACEAIWQASGAPPSAGASSGGDSPLRRWRHHLYTMRYGVASHVMLARVTVRKELPPVNPVEKSPIKLG
jgi:hypothetical protein